MPLADAAWPDLDTQRDCLLAVPVGSLEQHGPHLPLSTDTDIAVALVNAVAGQRPEVVAAPPISFGASGEHQGFPGAVSIGHAALRAVLLEVGRSATRTFPRVLFVNAHGGNLVALRQALKTLRSEGRDVMSFSADLGGDAHAGHSETCVMLHLHPRRVRLERAVAGNRAPLSELMPELIAHGVRHVAPNGVLGDPTRATAEAGRRMVSSETDRLSHLVGAWPSRA